MKSVVEYAEPKTPAELAHVIKLMLTDAFPRVGLGGGLEDDGGTIEAELDHEDAEIRVFSTEKWLAIDDHRYSRGGCTSMFLTGEEVRLIEAHRDGARKPTTPAIAPAV